MIEVDDNGVIVVPVPEQAHRKLAVRWLQLGVLALGLAGLFALLLVLSRTPGSEAFFPWVDFFRTALVVHVDQSVLIWFLAMSGVVWCLTAQAGSGSIRLQYLAFGLAMMGALGIALSAFLGDGAPLMNNYVPVLQRPLFFLTLGLFGFGIALQALIGLSTYRSVLWSRLHLPSLAAFTVALAVLISLAALLTAWWQIPAEVTGQSYYEYLFWGAGHSLQFAYTQLIILAWLWLALHSGVALPGNSRWYYWLLILGIAPVLLVPLIYLFYQTVTIESRTAFTQLMQYGGGLAVTPIGILIFIGLLQANSAEPKERPLRRSLWMSMLLFFSGGAIALFISGVNTIIPAHYHGSIVGVTMGLMGLAYLLLPKLGYPPVQGRLAELQPWIYGIGQLLHIAGLAMSGAMGIQRKTAGAAQGLDTLSAKLAMGVMGIGGLLAVIGGVIFVWVMLRIFITARS
ncbi:MAG: cbb3-type cytochrome c oxidase subunit I [Candidatus Thiodiazotropha endolucinida]|nr:cbb3-type cytochrome c oxidase subunit I [Candidatus Thiodiazotropha taylori]MCG8096164.1 cbb3-type cytochrome c oxidase subunit I [Candidatus Thiodiazotropha endolucinida]MCG8059244.1 cbb3-type cytochrome c oxidase subunit I [Candidatus Thiodiazotropha taylori]MCG8065720.1 cbb3-type cytochrome c oxidase subunit I [Candidatus Thiodiazotropha taylori]MCW4331814.1 cbb3-type cytochrome c oxidase subunit I [Candidatus Thiodiazotropha endolucinida]